MAPFRCSSPAGLKRQLEVGPVPGDWRHPVHSAQCPAGGMTRDATEESASRIGGNIDQGLELEHAAEHPALKTADRSISHGAFPASHRRTWPVSCRWR